MKRVLLTGANGQLARCLIDTAPADLEITALSSKDLDITSRNDLETVFQPGFDICINCAAYTAVDKAEEEPEKAHAVNADAVAHLAALCAPHDTLLVHYSTDYVYDNGLTRPLKESDPTSPSSVYARSKLAGEKLAIESCKKVLIVRTSWVYSEYGHNFVKTMARLADSGVSPNVVADQIGAPTYARDLAIATWTMVASYQDSQAGIYNYANSGVTNWYEFAQAIYALCGHTDKVSPTTTAAYGAKAPRPSYSVLDCTKVQAEFDLRPRPWHDALEECFRRLKEHLHSDN